MSWYQPGASTWATTTLAQLWTHCQTSNIRHTKSQNLDISHLVLQLSLPNPLKPGVKSIMKVQLRNSADRRYSNYIWMINNFTAWGVTYIRTLMLEANIMQHIQVAIAIKQTKMWCHFNMVNFLQNPHNRHPIAHPWGQDMGCLLWV